jgi:hypothetical protein
MHRVGHAAAPRPTVGDRLTKVGAAAAFTVVAAGVVSQLVDYGVYDLRIRLLNSANGEAVMNILVGAGLLAACAAALVVALARRPVRRPDVALAVALGFLVLDRLLGVHHHVPRWRVVYLPILAGTLLALALVQLRLAREARALLVAAMLLLGFSLVLHELGDWLMARIGEAPHSWAYQLKVGLKHGMEAAGWILVAVVLGAAARARERGPRHHSAPTGRAGVRTRG